MAMPTVALPGAPQLLIVPLTKQLIAQITGGLAERSGVLGFYDLSPGIERWARRRSAYGVTAYLHNEFFGGSGFHAAVAWHDDTIVWGPSFTGSTIAEAAAHHYEAAERHDMAANTLLRWLGVQRGTHIDEYAAAGLSRHRWTDDWAALAS